MARRHLACVRWMVSGKTIALIEALPPTSDDTRSWGVATNINKHDADRQAALLPQGQISIAY